MKHVNLPGVGFCAFLVLVLALTQVTAVVVNAEDEPDPTLRTGATTPTYPQNKRPDFFH